METRLLLNMKNDNSVPFCIENTKQIVYLKLKKMHGGNYHYGQLQLYDNKLVLLTAFLSFEVETLEKVIKLKCLILDSQISQIGYEMIDVMNEGPNIILYDLYSRGEELDYFELSIESFLHVLNEWGKILKLMPQEITVIQDGDKIIFEYEA